jgi:hypothetical protein
MRDEDKWQQVEHDHFIAKEVSTDWPKWVVVHESHVQRDKNGKVLSVPAYPGFHLSRVDGEVTVMVADHEEEAKAVGEKQ